MPRSLTAAVAQASAMFLFAAPLALAASEPVVPILYTGDVGGVMRQRGQANELAPLLDSDEGDGVRGDGIAAAPQALRHRGWHLWSADAKPLTARTARAAFAGGGLRLERAFHEVPLLGSEHVALIEEPGAEGPWLAAWLVERSQALMPDLALRRARVWAVRGDDGSKLRLLAETGAPPPPELLREPRAWHLESYARGEARRGGTPTSYHVFVRAYGGPAQLRLAARWRAEAGALRVDTGDLVDDPLDAAGAMGLGDTLAAVSEMRLDALVPGVNELRLGPPDLAALAAAAPLVAANLTGPPEARLRPWVIREHGGVPVGLLGIADVARLRRKGLLGGESGWSGVDGLDTVAAAIREVEAAGARVVVVVTNVGGDELAALRHAAHGAAAVIASEAARPDQSYVESFTAAPPGGARYRRPWLTVGAWRDQVGLLRLRLGRDGAGRLRPSSMANEVRRTPEQSEADAIADRAWRYQERLAAFIATRQDAVLPDMRVLAAHDARFRPQANGLVQFEQRRWSELAAAALRRACAAEVALILPLRAGPTTVGEIVRHHAEKWLVAEPVAVATIGGARLKALLAQRDASELVAAGVDRTRLTIAGRPIQDAERYRVATTRALLADEGTQAVFADATTGLGLRDGRLAPVAGAETTLREVVMASLDDMRARHGGFGPAYLNELAAWLTDDGAVVEPRWTLRVRPLEGTFQRFAVVNRGPFGAVRNAQVNNPDSTLAGGKANVALTYEAAEIDWEQRADLAYQRTEQVQGGAPQIAEQQDRAQLTSELRFKSLALRTPRAELGLVPFVNGNWLTEFTPTVDPASGRNNPLRRELNGIAGLVLYPGGWLKELRAGAIAKNDLAQATGGFEPGAQLAGSLEAPLGPLTLVFDADVKNYFLTPEDTADDLALLARFAPALRVPVWGALGLSFGVDAWVFSGKVPGTRELGWSWTPSVGLTYNATWKPLAGVSF